MSMGIMRARLLMLVFFSGDHGDNGRVNGKIPWHTSLLQRIEPAGKLSIIFWPLSSKIIVAHYSTSHWPCTLNIMILHILVQCVYFNLTCDGATKTNESSYGSLGMLNVELNQSLNQFDCSQMNKEVLGIESHAFEK